MRPVALVFGSLLAPACVAPGLATIDWDEASTSTTDTGSGSSSSTTTAVMTTTMDVDPGSSSTGTASGEASSSTSTTGTSGEVETTGTSTGSTSLCGDGALDDGEESGFEACDLGAGNSSEYGGCDGCQWGSHCGDGILDEGHEVCDLGELNGTGVAEDEGMGPCKATCSWQGRLVFLTSVGYTGALGGVDGADIRCRDRAKAAGFANASSFRAWLSDAAQSPATRFEQQALSEAPYILRNGRVVAEDFSELLDEGPRTGISIDETGAMVTETLVWTNTSGLGGTLHPVNHCDSWTSASAEHVAMTGLNALAVEAGPSWETWRAERRWTVLQSFRCEFAQRLYCFEDGYAPED